MDSCAAKEAEGLVTAATNPGPRSVAELKGAGYRELEAWIF